MDTGCGLTETLMVAVANLSLLAVHSGLWRDSWRWERCSVGSWSKETAGGPGILEEHGKEGEKLRWRNGFYKRLALNYGIPQLVHLVLIVRNRAFQLGMLFTLLSVPLQ